MMITKGEIKQLADIVKKLSAINMIVRDVGGHISLQYSDGGPMIFFEGGTGSYTFQKRIEFEPNNAKFSYAPQFEQLYQIATDLEAFVRYSREDNILLRLFNLHKKMKESNKDINSFLMEHQLSIGDNELSKSEMIFAKPSIISCKNEYQREKLLSIIIDKIRKLDHFIIYTGQNCYPNKMSGVTNVNVSTDSTEVLMATAFENCYKHPTFSTRTIVITLCFNINKFIVNEQSLKDIEYIKQKLMDVYKVFNLVDVINLLPNRQSVLTEVQYENVNTGSIENSIDQISNLEYSLRFQPWS